MSAECGNCSQPLSAKARYCPRCGAPTAIASLLIPSTEKTVYNRNGVIVTTHQVRLGNVAMATGDISAVDTNRWSNNWPSGITAIIASVVAAVLLPGNSRFGPVGVLCGVSLLVVGIVCASMHRTWHEIILTTSGGQQRMKVDKAVASQIAAAIAMARKESNAMAIGERLSLPSQG